jgi:selenocysteine lyase/cysteine desulfurase
VKDLDREFPLEPDTLYLNHAAVAPWPRRASEAVKAFADECARTGARFYPRWLETEQRLREQLARMIHVTDTDDIALLKNTSEGLSVIAQGLPWESGDRVLITDQEFPSNRIPWQALADRGVQTVEAPLEGDDPEGAIIERLDSRTRLLSVSSVQYGTGLRLDLARLGRACRDNGTLFCIDAIQSIGAGPLDAPGLGADFVVADGHKWMLGPEGLALFYCAPEARRQLTLRQHGWHMIENPGDYDRREWTPARSARRFECGSPNLLCAHALSASLSLLLEAGLERVAGDIEQHIDRIQARLDASGAFVQITPRDPERRAGIITFRPASGDTDALYQKIRDAGVVCAKRGGGIRFSPHFYTPLSTVDGAMDILLG